MSQLTWSKQFTWSKNLTWNGQAPTTEKDLMNHVSLSFAKKNDTDLLAFSLPVHDAFVANPTVVTTCPVTAAQLASANQDFSAKLAATKQGGTTATLDKETSRAALLVLLREIAAWLEGKALGNVDLITQLAFASATRAKHPQTQLAKPELKHILNELTTQLKLRASPVTNAHSYEVQSRTGSGAWTAAGTFTQARAIVVPNLTPGTVYEFRVRAIGGSTGYSDWSDPVSHMCL